MPVRSPQIYVQYGMKRSGNHAISSWLIPKLEVAYVNNAAPLSKIQRGAIAMPDLGDYRRWYRGRKAMAWLRPVPSRILVSIEDFPLSLGAFRQGSGTVTDILILRSAENLFSSRIKKAFKVDMPAYPRAMGRQMQGRIALWKAHATAFLDPALRSKDAVAIYFDAWVADPVYRAAICARLGIAAGDDDNRDQVTRHGGGSSFHGTEFDGRAGEMDVTRRAEMLKGDEAALYAQVFADTELRDLAARVTGADPIKLL